LIKKIPYYDTRHAVRPGITDWPCRIIPLLRNNHFELSFLSYACFLPPTIVNQQGRAQANYPYGTSVEGPFRRRGKVSARRKGHSARLYFKLDRIYPSEVKNVFTGQAGFLGFICFLSFHLPATRPTSRAQSRRTGEVGKDETEKIQSVCGKGKAQRAWCKEIIGERVKLIAQNKRI